MFLSGQFGLRKETLTKGVFLPLPFWEIATTDASHFNHHFFLVHHLEKKHYNATDFVSWFLRFYYMTKKVVIIVDPNLFVQCYWDWQIDHHAAWLALPTRETCPCPPPCPSCSLAVTIGVLRWERIHTQTDSPQATGKTCERLELDWQQMEWMNIWQDSKI